MIYSYHWSYDSKDDSFYAFVDDGTRAGTVIFQIDNTEAVCKLISDGDMSHIDDTDGLEDYLKERALIQEEDSLLIRETEVW